MICPLLMFLLFKYPASSKSYTLSLHDALPIYRVAGEIRDHAEACRRDHDRHDGETVEAVGQVHRIAGADHDEGDRKSTRLNSSHVANSYAVICLKKKKRNKV